MCGSNVIRRGRSTVYQSLCEIYARSIYLYIFYRELQKSAWKHPNNLASPEEKLLQRWGLWPRKKEIPL